MTKNCFVLYLIGGALFAGSSDALASSTAMVAVAPSGAIMNDGDSEPTPEQGNGEKHRMFGADYVTELQTDFRGGYDWLNLLQAWAEVPIARGLSFEARTVSCSKTHGEPLVEDLLTYSNIEAGNIPLTFARLGFGFSFGSGAELFAGINNVNEDYFTSPLTSFFTNSSCGISPTISCNYDIANYPLAAWCLHYRQALGCFSLQTSVYPGRGYYRLLGHDNLFTLNPGRDGVFSITSLDYERNGIYCVLGIALHYGECLGDADSPQEQKASAWPQKSFSAAPWLLAELTFPCNLGVHLHGSYSSVRSGCRWYGGAGMIYSGWRVEPGVAFNYAKFTEAQELSMELTCRIPLLKDRADLQPALHLVSTDGAKASCVALLRFQVSI